MEQMNQIFDQKTHRRKQDEYDGKHPSAKQTDRKSDNPYRQVYFGNGREIDVVYHEEVNKDGRQDDSDNEIRFQRVFQARGH